MRRLAAAAIVAAAASCTVGQGTGSVTGTLDVLGCRGEDLSNYSYDMEPNFFGAIARENQLIIRIQKGGDIQEYSDSVTISVEDTRKVVDGQPIEVKLHRPPGSAPSVEPPLVRITLSLRGLCGSGRVGPRDNPQVVLHAVSGTITFNSILRGDPSSPDTNAKRIEGSFDVVLEDPRHAEGTPARIGGKLRGDFKFFYQRGGPAQPFP